MGPGTQSEPLDFKRLVEVDVNEVVSNPKYPVKPGWAVVLFSFFLLRELEMAGLKYKHVIFDEAALTITLMLTVSKTDPEARGCRRVWGCLCQGNPATPCPFHAGTKIKQAFVSTFKREPSDDDAFFVNGRGRPCTKEEVVRFFMVIATATGTKAKDGQRSIGGHSARVSGARFLAGIGL